MTPQEKEIDNWKFEAIRSRFHAFYGINLTIEQAKEINVFEQEKSIYSEKYYFSIWEEWDYELSTFKKILKPEQFAIFEQNVKNTVENYQQSLIEQDIENLKEIEFNKAAIQYYEEQFLQDFFKDPALYSFIWLSADKAKIEFLKAEYKKFLNESKKQILIDHFRHNRLFKPNELEASLLRHKISYLWPDYFSFKSQMDEPTKAMSEYLLRKLKYFIEKYDELIVNKLEGLQIFHKNNFEKYHDKRNESLHIVFRKTNSDEEKENRVMSLLLLDQEKYGC
ncbi:hypothetical protein ACFOWM_07155 [Ferruginibacter yonginensis]|uniref:Uncharacterized protein n=1 Tax=Ferruginibacter yonginensis TaxID=1310416 RepID=A0ABV8QTD3_9BACT